MDDTTTATQAAAVAAIAGTVRRISRPSSAPRVKPNSVRAAKTSPEIS